MGKVERNECRKEYHNLYVDPRMQEVSTRDIAHALSLLCRAHGHYRHFYRIAQHSLNCAKEAQLRVMFGPDCITPSSA